MKIARVEKLRLHSTRLLRHHGGNPWRLGGRPSPI